VFQRLLKKIASALSRHIEKWLAEFDTALDKKYRETFAVLQKKLK